MAIKTSASQEVRRLIADLTGGESSPTKREAARARLTVIGTRAVRQLVDALAAATTGEGRATVLSALEAIPDAHAVKPILGTSGVERPSRAPRGRARCARAARSLTEHDVLDRLTSIAVDRTQPGELRAAAVEALATLPARTVRPVLEGLKTTPRLPCGRRSPPGRSAGQSRRRTRGRVRRLAAARPGHAAGSRGASGQRRASVHPPSPDRTGAVEGRRARQRTAQRLARRARRPPSGARAPGQPRGAVRPAGAHRTRRRAGSRRLLEALSLVGDAASLEPVAAACVQSSSMPDAERVAPGSGSDLSGDCHAGRDHGAQCGDAATREVPLPRARGARPLVNTPLRTAPR